MMLPWNSECFKFQKTQTTRGTKQLFLKAVSVWVNKPHVVNRRLCGSTVVQVIRCQTREEAEQALTDIQEVGRETKSWPSGAPFKDLSDEHEPYTFIVRDLVPKSEFFPRIYEVVVYDKEKSTVTFLPLSQNCEENGRIVAPTEELSYCIKFQSVVGDDFPPWAQVNDIVLSWSCDHTETGVPRCQVSSQWLCSVLLVKLVNWSQVNDISTSATSLLLVPVDRYKETYVRLKNTYGRELVKNWTEKTDPLKFVYEDVAIAAYLLLIWEEERQKKGLTQKQSFVDMGCGNGLLVYILSKEGHKGLGIDLRRRKIWDTFGPDIDLREETISPSSENLFPDYDWLIGNHSDELTPWIPVIAARSSYNCRFFVLPCCPFDFVGKFADCKKGQSRYGTYLDYVKQIVSYCGFQPEMDTLRIPSTKRICFIGKERSYKAEAEDVADAKRQAFIDKRTALRNLKGEQTNSIKQEKEPETLLPSFDSGFGDMSDQDIEEDDANILLSIRVKKHNLDLNTHPSPKRMKLERSFSEVSSSSADSKDDPRVKDTSRADNEKWAQGFQPRSSDPGIRNCQTVPEETKLKIVNSVFDLVLRAEDSQRIALSGGKLWSKGGTASLSEVASLFDQLTLQQLKSECGGLQTLLRNHSHVFQVTSGRVRLRDFSAADPWQGCNPHKRHGPRGKFSGRDRSKGQGEQQDDRRKTTLCWFYSHHPDGCPRPSDHCLFAHGHDELRAKPVKQKV